ncbi:uncharacterized protein KQ657_001139 [Scheffersomyces spartinae]|uniref:Uncharacterized protein n=1 Tax=Scheffersomyces spartinae TaxID=45513 RepID=A0A9P7V8J2_9ASCO|nr:uncharacterized protein KQ657_001139 [Scheffersomyces spartinae]KAG7193024.1 hypothetical protein KQ657_001139 [Scheffersomyces spartinae]
MSHRHQHKATAANNEKNLAILKQLLRETPNRTCADCKTSQHPRWASWSLGCFICIRCSGIHRGMGTHISKVKSVDLDTWKDDEVENMIRWGNQKSNQFWEAKLPDGYIPDLSKIENFIKTKYDMKKWAASSKLPDPLTLGKASSSRGANPGSANSNINSSKPASTNLLDDDEEFGDFSANSSGSITPQPTPKSNNKPPAPKLYSQLTSQINLLPPVPPKVHGTSQHTVSTSAIGNLNIATPPTPSANNGRADLKKSILSLYSSPSSSNSSFFNNSSSIPAPRNNYNSSTSTITNPALLSNSLQSLNLSGQSTLSQRSSSPQVRSAVTSETTKSTSQWNNEWSSQSTSTSKPLNSNSTPMDDELLKNVWG